VTGPARRQLDLEIPEDAYLATVQEALGRHHWLHYHIRDAGRSGFPALIAVKGERLLALEVKRENGRPTPEQDTWLGALRRVPGVTAECVRPSDWGRVQTMLTRTGPRAFGHDP
jgi:hypothetical protein